jgi:hypothetical protein
MEAAKIRICRLLDFAYVRDWWPRAESNHRHADFQFYRGNWVNREINRLPTLAITQSNLDQRRTTCLLDHSSTISAHTRSG